MGHLTRALSVENGPVEQLPFQASVPFYALNHAAPKQGTSVGWGPASIRTSAALPG
jgi:hypothetical protein